MWPIRGSEEDSIKWLGELSIRHCGMSKATWRTVGRISFQKRAYRHVPMSLYLCLEISEDGRECHEME